MWALVIDSRTDGLTLRGPSLIGERGNGRGEKGGRGEGAG